MSFSVGQVVRLKSGGPKMTIAEITDDGDAAICYWQEKGVPKHFEFPLAVLKDASQVGAVDLEF